MDTNLEEDDEKSFHCLCPSCSIFGIGINTNAIGAWDNIVKVRGL